MSVAMNDRDPSAKALTFSIRNSYRHPSAELEQFLTTRTSLTTCADRRGIPTEHEDAQFRALRGRTHTIWRVAVRVTVRLDCSGRPRCVRPLRQMWTNTLAGPMADLATIAGLTRPWDSIRPGWEPTTRCPEVLCGSGCAMHNQIHTDVLAEGVGFRPNMNTACS